MTTACPKRLCVKVGAKTIPAKRQKISFATEELDEATHAAVEIMSKRKDCSNGKAEVLEIARRRRLFKELECVYVGRPVCDGGAYRVPEFKHGSVFANPFPVKQSSLERSLSLFANYIKRRTQTDNLAELYNCLPADIQGYLDSRKPEVSRSKVKIKFDYLRLVETKYGPSLLGADFGRALKSLEGKNLGCFCDFGAPCHADELLRLANAESESKKGDSTGQSSLDI